MDRVVEALQANTDWENMVMKPQDYHNRYNLHRKEGNKSFIEEVEDDDNQQDRQKVEDGVVVEEDDEQWIDDDEEFDDDDDDDDDEILAEMNKYLSLDDDENNDNTSTHSTNLELEAELKHLKSLFHSLKDNDLSSSASPPVSTITPTTTTSDDLGIDIDGDKHALNDQDLDADHISLMFAKLQKLKGK